MPVYLHENLILELSGNLQSTTLREDAHAVVFHQRHSTTKLPKAGVEKNYWPLGVTVLHTVQEPGIGEATSGAVACG